MHKVLLILQITKNLLHLFANVPLCLCICTTFLQLTALLLKHLGRIGKLILFPLTPRLVCPDSIDHYTRDWPILSPWSRHTAPGTRSLVGCRLSLLMRQWFAGRCVNRQHWILL